MSPTTGTVTTTQTKTTFEHPKLHRATRFYSIDAEGKQCIPSGLVIDWNKGLLNQIPHLKMEYNEWIEHATHHKMRMFDTELLESFSKTPWWLVPALYIPWACCEFRESVLAFGEIVSPLFFFLVGLFAWSFFEYNTHRFAFHWKISSPWQIWIHFLGHGLHHVVPFDKGRLVFPIAISFPIGILIRTLYYTYLPEKIAPGFLSGFMVGYALYESTHFLSHHDPKLLYLKIRAKYHNQHHFHPAKKGSLFGVTTCLWDFVYGTL